MRSLFVRLFLAFWLTAFLSGAIFSVVAFQLRPGRMEMSRPPIPPVMPPPGLHGPPGGVHPGAMPPGHPPGGFLLKGFSVHLAIYFVVGGFICYLLAWRLTAPLRTLRSAAQRLAAGDLSARTNVGSHAQGDEIADLGRDFDRMAERIEALMHSQKQLVRDISHELRSPLARLSVALELSRRHANSASGPALDRIEQETARLNDMIGELLTLSLLEGGGNANIMELFDLSSLVAEVVEDCDFEAVADNRRVELSAIEGIQINGNRELLRRALENVVRNALRYTASGSAVEVMLSNGAGQEVSISVRDHGPGVPKEALAEIFRPFYRVAESRDRQSGGAGIGLAIAARAVELHGGSIKALNMPDGGLEIDMVIPV